MHLSREGRILKEHVLQIIRQAQSITKEELNLVRLKDPITIVGDIHGQYFDLLKLLDVGGDPSTTQYLFLGDYVDRGTFSVESLLLLMALKINYPRRIWLLRGNHECRQMTQFFNFRDECTHKYDMSVYQAFTDFFDTLPLSAMINNKFLAVHGGLSPDLSQVSQVSQVNRFSEPPRQGLFCDLLWADPADEEKEEHLANNGRFFPNDVRGCSYFFGFEAACNFLERNSLLAVIRAHEAQLEGYKMHRPNAKTENFPTVITVFSAPNYCDCYGNKAAVLKFENNTLNIQQYTSAGHPYYLPSFMDLFSWSLPFVFDKVGELMHVLLSDPAVSSKFELESDEVSIRFVNGLLTSNRSGGSLRFLGGGSSANETKLDFSGVVGQKLLALLKPKNQSALRTKMRRARTKVLVMVRISRILKILKKHASHLTDAKSHSFNGRLPVGFILGGLSDNLVAHLGGRGEVCGTPTLAEFARLGGSRGAVSAQQQQNSSGLSNNPGGGGGSSSFGQQQQLLGGGKGGISSNSGNSGGLSIGNVLSSAMGPSGGKSFKI